MRLLPDWAPNLHPLVIHFPIALLLTAAIVDLIDTVFQRPHWLSQAGTCLYAAGAGCAIVAYVTGLQAADTVLIPGMAHPLVAEHQSWALATTGYFTAVASVRVVAQFSGVPRSRGHRLALFVTGLVGVVLLWQTAERGARLVYEHGVGVIATAVHNCDVVSTSGPLPGGSGATPARGISRARTCRRAA